MNGSVLRNSLWQARRTLLVLPVASGVFHYLVLFSSSSFLSEAGDVPFLSDPPRAIEAFLGGSADFFAPAGWLAAAMTHPITLAIMVAAALTVAAGAVASEIERGSIDLVLSRPVGRVPFLAAKAAGSIVFVTAAEAGGLVGALAARLTVDRVDEITLPAILGAFGGSWLLFVAFAMVGVLASARSSLRGRALGLAVGLVVAWFFLNFVALLIDGIAWLRFASPFHYFRPAEILGGEALAELFVPAGLGALALGTALWRFARRDLTH